MNIEVNDYSEQNQRPTRLRWPISQPTGPKLAQNDVHLWCVQFGGFCDDIPGLWSVLSDRERQRAQSFRFEKDRYSYAFRWGLLRHLLSRYNGISPAKHKFTRGQFGKPELHVSTREKPIFFNMSHSGSTALYAFTRAVAVGVDIERIRHLDDLDDIAGGFFTSREASMLCALPHSSRLEAFFNCWTRKEAILKSIGKGITEGLDGIEVSVALDQPARVLNIKGDVATAKHWSLHALDPAYGYAAALAYQGPELNISCCGLDSSNWFSQQIGRAAVQNSSPEFALSISRQQSEL